MTEQEKLKLARRMTDALPAPEEIRDGVRELSGRGVGG